MNTIIKTALLALSLTAWHSANGAPAPDRQNPSPDSAFSQALEMLKAGRHAGAYGRLMKLADAGHAPSARLAMVMATHGKAIYGSDWYASPNQLASWNALVVNQMRHHLPVVALAYGE
jgi:hypothetical protein